MSAQAPGHLAPEGTNVPSISGTPVLGQQLSASAGDWRGPAPSYTYQWARCNSTGLLCSTTAGANLQTYKTAAGDLGSTVRVVVTATNKNGSAVATSAATSVVTAPPAPSTGTTTTTTGPATTTTSPATTTATSTTASTTTTPITTSTTTWTTTTTAATTTTPASGTVVFSGNFETGDYSQWSGTGGGCCRTFVTDVVDQGKYAMRHDLGANTSNNRSELDTGHTRSYNLYGHDYYSTAIRLPSGFNWSSVGTWGLQISQWNMNDVWGAPVGLRVWDGGVRLILMSGDCAFGTGCAYSNGPSGNLPAAWAIPIGRVTGATWYELVVHVYVSDRSDGVVEAWYRPRGAAEWTKTVDIHGYPTCQSGLSYVDNMYRKCGDSSYKTTDKFGAYRSDSPYSLTLWNDANCRATAFSAAASCFG